MRCLTLWQPWAMLVAIGAKRVETRSWGTQYRGPLAIHAAKAFPKVARGVALSYPFRDALRRGGIERGSDLPLGAVIATARLTDCIRIKPAAQRSLWDAVDIPNEDSEEFCFGDYTAGRWMWLLADIERLAEPVPARGALGLWDWRRREPGPAAEAAGVPEGEGR